MVCKLGNTVPVNPGTAVTGDTILVPFTMYEGASTGSWSSMPKPGMSSTSPIYTGDIA